MAEPENQTLRVLRDIRNAIKAMDGRIKALDLKVDRNHVDLGTRIDNIRQAAFGESVLGR
jgi:hypothetical protein